MIGNIKQENINEYRYERKFFITKLDRRQVEQIVLQNSQKCFREIYYERFVNNIYLDYFNKKNYVENVEGGAERTKYRIRWYDDLFGAVKKPVLELKIKKSLLGKKRSFKLKPFLFKRGFTMDDLVESFAQSILDGDAREELKKQEPTLVNRYRRKYYQSTDKKFRITIDDFQTFYQIGSRNNNFLYKKVDKSNVILELKYGQDLYKDAHQITSSFPFRMTKSSKYVRGVDSTF